MKTRSRLIIIYTILFFTLCIVVFYPFYSNGKSFVWGAYAQDGLSQHLNAAAYWGQYIRQFAANLFSGHIKFPMWDMALGYGGDILAVLNYYAIGDPINLIYVFSNKYNAEYFYDFAILLRMYLAGISFIIYGSCMKKHSHGILIGSLVYVFSGISLQVGLHHPFFLNPMIYLPLLFLGIEKIYREERPYLFISMVTISAVSNFYFFYMLTVISVLYALIRFFSYEKEHRWKGFFCTLGKFSGFFCLGIGISAVIFLPVILGFMGNGRNGGAAGIYPLYSVRYYGRLITEFSGYGEIGLGTRLNFVPLALFGIVILFLQNKKETWPYKAAVILCAVCLAFPICGYVLHGFSYPSNRWTFAAAFVVSIVITEIYPQLFALEGKQKIGICAGTGGCVLFCTIIKIFHGETIIQGWKAACLVMIGFAAGLLIMNFWNISEKGIFGHIWIGAMVCFSIGVSGVYHYSPNKSNELKSYLNRGEAYETLCNSEIQLLKEAKERDKDLYRVEAGRSRIYNFGLLDGIANTTNYFSITDKNTAETIRDFGNLGYKYLFKFRKMDQREGLLSLFSVKYRTSAKNAKGKSSAPAGFLPLAENKEYRLYENKNVLPFGYTYDSYITEAEYQKLNASEKEQALLKYAVVSQEDQQLRKAGIQIPVVEKQIDLSKKKMVVTKGHSLHYHFKIPVNPDKENYLQLEGMAFEQTREKGSRFMKPKVINSETFPLYTGKKKYKVRIQQKESIYYFGERSYFIKLQTKKGETYKTFDLVLNKPGTYTMKGISSVQADTEEMLSNLQKRKESECLENIRYDNGNHFSGEITSKGNRMLCIPIPYSKGWKAFDHGKQVSIQKVNGMFIGISLKKGKHKIQLNYVTPGIQAGAVITLISLCVLAGIIVRKK